jgi:NADH-ubiquinone oxidoreductase chain 1
MFINIIIPLSIILAIAILTLIERKILANVQRRVGPQIVGYTGLLQPIADALKLLLKEIIVPSLANVNVFIGAPIIIFIVSLINYSIIP